MREKTDQIFMALADPTRRNIVEMLAGGRSLRISDIADRFESTRQSITKHLNILSAAGITSTEWHGRERYTAIAESAFDPIREWLEHYDQFWDEKLAELKKLVEKERE